EHTSIRMAGQLAFVLNDHVVTIPPEGEAVACTFDLHTAILLDQPAGMSNRSCQFAGFDGTPDPDVLEEIGAGDELDGTDLERLAPPVRRTHSG
ncbi:MAG: hypothetical protein ACOC0X_01240, partial [Halobacteriota archaeon]